MIRPATILDIPAILCLCREYQMEEAREEGRHTTHTDYEYLARNLCETLAAGAFLYVGVSDNKVVGFLWAVTHALAPWNPRKVASDLLFYILPEKRGCLIGAQLVKSYRSWAEAEGCYEARLSLASGINEERTGKMYNKLGFDYFGIVYNSTLRSDYGRSEESIIGCGSGTGTAKA